MRKTFGIAAALFAAAVSGGVATRAFAQEKPCMADAARLCPGVEPGGGAQIACLKEHKEELSPACKKKVMQAKIKHEESKQLEEQKANPPETPQPAPPNP
jgi:Cysteine rich repeat